MELNQLIDLYNHCVKIQVRFKDIDKQGHVNNANHLTYFETARVEYFRDVFRNKIDWVNKGMILGHSEITYKRPIFLEDNLFCYTKISRFGKKSFDIENILIIKNSDTPELAAFGKSTLVCMDYNTKQTIEIPEEWVEAVKSFEKNDL